MANRLLIFILIIFSLNCSAQQPKWVNYTSSYLLSSIIHVDNDIWFGGVSSGLIRLNSDTWEKTIYTMANSDIPSNSITCLASDNQGNIWMGLSLFVVSTNYGGVARFDGDTWEIYTTENSGLPSSTIQAMAFTENGDLWVCTSQNGIGVYDGSSWIYYDPSNSIVPISIIDIEITDDGDIWVGSPQSGVYKFDGVNWVNFNESNSELPNNNIGDIEVDEYGNIWIGSTFNGALTKIDTDGNWVMYNKDNSGISSNSIASIYSYDGAIWLAMNSAGGVCCFKNSEWEVYNPVTSGLSSSFNMNICVDGNGVVWVSSHNYGADSFDGTNWHNHLYNFGKLPGAGVKGIAMGNNGKIWIATVNGLAIKDSDSWEYLNPYNSILKDRYISSVATDANGNCWMGNAMQGLFYHNGTELIDYTSTNPSFEGKNIEVLETHDNSLWAGSYNGGVSVYDGENWINYRKDNSGLPDNFPHAFAFDQEGAVWIASNSGLSVKYSNDTWEDWDCDNSNMPCSKGYDIAIDGEGNKWIGTKKGLVKFDGTDFTIFDTMNSEIPSDIVWTLAIDSSGKIWIGTSLGMASFDGESLWEVFNYKNTPVSGPGVNIIEIDAIGSKWLATGGIAVYNENGVVDVFENKLTQNDILSLENYPNPCSKSTIIKYKLSNSMDVVIKIYDQFGSLTATFNEGIKNEGEHELTVRTEEYHSGIYYYQISTPGFQSFNKMIICN